MISYFKFEVGCETVLKISRLQVGRTDGQPTFLCPPKLRLRMTIMKMSIVGESVIIKRPSSPNSGMFCEVIHVDNILHAKDGKLCDLHYYKE